MRYTREEKCKENRLSNPHLTAHLLRGTLPPGARYKGWVSLRLLSASIKQSRRLSDYEVNPWRSNRHTRREIWVEVVGVRLMVLQGEEMGKGGWWGVGDKVEKRRQFCCQILWCCHTNLICVFNTLWWPVLDLRKFWEVRSGCLHMTFFDLVKFKSRLRLGLGMNIESLLIVPDLWLII